MKLYYIEASCHSYTFIVFYLPFGLLNIMPRCKMLTDKEYKKYKKTIKSEWNIESKSDSWGRLNKKGK